MFRRATINSQLHDAVEAYEKHGSQRIAAESLGIPLSTLRGRLKRAGAVSGSTTSRIKKQEDVEKGNTTVTASGSTIRTVEELLEAAEIDLDEWELLEATVNAWGNDDNQNFQVKARLRRKVPVAVTEAVDDLLESLKKVSPKSRGRRPPPDKGNLMVYGLHDVHFGLLAWGPETGGDSYDFGIAKQVFENAVFDLWDAAQQYNPSKVVFILGSDMFHSNDSRDRTFSGTPLDCDGRHSKVFAETCRLLSDILTQLSQETTLYCPLISGNHDTEVAGYAAHVVEAYFHNNNHVEVDTRPTLRKYLTHGANLIGITHGHDIKLDQLPLLMATEVPDLWAATKFREVQTGHLHRAREMRYLALDEFNGIRVRVNPTLCSQDAWHSSKGYSGSRRAGEAYIYNDKCGYVGSVATNART